MAAAVSLDRIFLLPVIDLAVSYMNLLLSQAVKMKENSFSEFTSV